MTRRNTILLFVALLVVAITARLGVWQLHRHGERRAYNASVLAGLERPPITLDSLRTARGVPEYQRVLLDGRYDSDNELVLANRVRRGSPGVHLLTPLFAGGSDTAVLVVRGWIYSPDATHADTGRWREDSAAGAVGYVREFEPPISGRRATLEPRILQRLTYDDAAAALTYPLAPYLIVLTDEGEPVGGAPPRLDPPALGDGNHLGYAFQWFAFGAVALAGTLVFLRHSRRSRDGEEERFQP